MVRSLPFFWKHPVLWASFMRNGFVVVDNFLSESEFKTLRPRCAEISENYWRDNPLVRTNEKGFGSKIYKKGGFDRFDGDSANRFIYIDKNSVINNIYCGSPKMDSICKSLFGMKNKPSRHHLYELVHGDESVNHDIQRDLHADTFHNTFKIWYYLDDLSTSDGPTEFIPSSHISSLRRLIWEYRKSNIKKAGSVRITLDEAKEMGLPDPVKLICSKNSLVIVNTKGFHRRGNARRDTVRGSIYANFRPQAFRPFLH